MTIEALKYHNTSAMENLMIKITIWWTGCKILSVDIIDSKFWTVQFNEYELTLCQSGLLASETDNQILIDWSTNYPSNYDWNKVSSEYSD